jgi:hypothetical protein
MTHYRITRKSILRSSWRERVHSGNTTVPRIKNFDKSKYLKTLESSLKTLDIKWSSTKTKEELDVVEGIITNTIATCTTSTCTVEVRSHTNY